jgi:hypothetical protein
MRRKFWALFLAASASVNELQRLPVEKPVTDSVLTDYSTRRVSRETLPSEDKNRARFELGRTPVFDSGMADGIVFSGVFILQEACLQNQDTCESGTF